MTFLQWVVAHATAAIFWQAVAFMGVAWIIIYTAKIQKTPENGIDFFQLIQAKDCNPPRLDPERFAYTGTFIVTSVGYIFGVTRPSATLEGIATLTATYGALWVAGKAAKAWSDRPAAPVVPPAAPQVVVQTTGQPAPGTTTTTTTQ